MKNLRLRIRALRTRLIVMLATSFFPSMLGVGLIKCFLLPRYLLRNARSWRRIARDTARLAGNRSAAARVFRHYEAQTDHVIWTTLAYEAWDATLRCHDFRDVEELRAAAARGKGLLLLGMHYGPMITAYALYRLGLNPAVLISQTNIPTLRPDMPRRFFSGQAIFRATYDGMVEAQRFLRRFVEMVIGGRPGLILNDLDFTSSAIPAKCLGGEFPVPVFPFKLALGHGIPTYAVWLSRLKGRGYKLNVKPLDFRNVEEGVAAYASVLDQAVADNPFSWAFTTVFGAP